jgi:hypothetical protein
MKKRQERHRDSRDEIARLRWEFIRRNRSNQDTFPNSDFDYQNARYYLSPIYIGHFKKEKGFANLGSKPNMSKFLSAMKGKESSPHMNPINAVNEKDNTIIVKIHLDRTKGEIITDLQKLLRLLDEQAKPRGIKFRRTKPHLKEYENYLKVYDLRKKDKRTWPNIALEIFPAEMAYNKKRKKIPEPSAVSKVRNYYNQAVRMIDKNEWRLI